jgi:hypothetical protein
MWRDMAQQGEYTKREVKLEAKIMATKGDQGAQNIVILVKIAMGGICNFVVVVDSGLRLLNKMACVQLFTSV